MTKPNIPPGATPSWAEGYAARVAGKERQGNPYLNCADVREDQWDDGWLFADVEITRTNISAVKHTKDEKPRH